MEDKQLSHLLQPIRDLCKNWDIDIATHLHDYLEELEKIAISFDGGFSTMNFSEAALIIQGSACVYSKKVEHLYSLVYQTLNLLSRKHKDGKASSVDVDGQDEDLSMQADKELLTLDDIKEGQGIDLIELVFTSKAVSAVPRMPMSLVPYKDSEKSGHSILYSRTGEVLGSRMDFKMNTSIIHSTGALLLEPIEDLSKAALAKKKNFQAPGLASNVITAQKSSVLKGNLDESYTYGDCWGSPVAMTRNGSDIESEVISTVGLSVPPDLVIPSHPSTQRDRQQRSNKNNEDTHSDHWNLLDPHQQGRSDERPLKPGYPFKIPSKPKGSRKHKAVVDLKAPDETLVSFIQQQFYSEVALFPKVSYKVPVYAESELMFWKESRVRKRQQKIVSLKLNQAKRVPVQEDKPEDDNDYDTGLDHDPENDYGASDGDDYVQERVDGVLANVVDQRDTIVENIMVSEPLCMDVSMDSKSSYILQSYEQLVRNYVEIALNQAKTYAQETELSKRVSEWDSRIRPQLMEEERHPPFDIHAYGAKVITNLKMHNKERVFFNEIVKNQDCYEMYRTFAATLQLANTYNVTIETERGESESGDITSLHLLSDQMIFEDLANFRAPSVKQAEDDVFN